VSQIARMRLNSIEIGIVNSVFLHLNQRINVIKMNFMLDTEFKIYDNISVLLSGTSKV